MRREGHIIEEVVEYSNMAESFDQVLSGTKRKKSRQGRYLIAHREEVIKELSERIASGTFHVTAKDIEEKDIIEAGKLRHIQFFKKLKNSIAVHAIMSVVDKHLKKRFIRTTSASIKDRGMHDLMKYIRRDMQEDPEGTIFMIIIGSRPTNANIMNLWSDRNCLENNFAFGNINSVPIADNCEMIFPLLGTLYFRLARFK